MALRGGDIWAKTGVSEESANGGASRGEVVVRVQLSNRRQLESNLLPKRK